ncbi:MAG: M20/M25/M40 family metallo-hydrolase [Bacteroidales bacterium]
MKKLVISIIFIPLFINMLHSQTEEQILNILHEFNRDSIQQTVLDLQAFPNRLVFHGNREVAQYLTNRLHRYGIENATIDSFYVERQTGFGSIHQYLYNVKGSIIGEQIPDSFLIIGSHLDAISFDENQNLIYDQTGGADDNASGIAVMIEMARIFQKFNIKPTITIDFMAFDGEELGLIGSAYDAQQRREHDQKLSLMLNNDMISHTLTDEWEVILFWYPNAMNIVTTTQQLCENYIPRLTPYVHPNEESNYLSHFSDSYSYYQQNFKALFFCEKDFSPYYHTLSDVAANYNFDYACEVAKLNFVTLFHYAVANIPLSANQSVSHNLGKIQVYPNPASHSTNVSFNLSENTTVAITLFDITGKQVSESIFTQTFPEGNHTITINLSELTAGVYFCKISTNQKSEIRKLIIQ